MQRDETVNVVSPLDASYSSSYSADYLTAGQLTQPDYSSSESDLLQNIQEIDYLAPAALAASSANRQPDAGNLSPAGRHSPRGRGHNHPMPIFQKVVLSREQLLQRLQEAGYQEGDEVGQLKMLQQLAEQQLEEQQLAEQQLAEQQLTEQSLENS
jgi:hypothetical protein